MFVDYVKQTWSIPYKQIFVKAWTNKVIHLGNTTTKRYENGKCILVLIRTHLWIKIIVCVFQIEGSVCTLGLKETIV